MSFAAAFSNTTSASIGQPVRYLAQHFLDQHQGAVGAYSLRQLNKEHLFLSVSGTVHGSGNYKFIGKFNGAPRWKHETSDTEIKIRPYGGQYAWAMWNDTTSDPALATDPAPLATLQNQRPWNVAFANDESGFYPQGTPVIAPAVVQVRRGSDDTVKDFSAIEVADGSLEAFCQAGDGFAAKWYDQTGIHNHLVQNNHTSQPKLVSGGVLDAGGLDFSFGSGQQSLQMAGGLSFTNPNFIAVLSHDSASADYASLLVDSNSNDALWLTQSFCERYLRDTFDQVNLATALNPAWQDNVLSVSLNPEEGSHINCNGTQFPTVSANLTSLDLGTVGYDATWGQPAKFKLRELIMWDKNQSAKFPAMVAKIGAHYSIL